MIAFRCTLQFVLGVLRLAVRVTVAIANFVATLLLWLAAPRACLAAKVLQHK